jgi:NTP pyrophosphatase (non-canonical NTP hydrolase)
MKIKEVQDKIREFDEARGWGEHWNIKDLLLNITEEGGEIWNLLKWIDDEKQKKIVNEHREEVSDYIGDTLFILLKIANQVKVDASQALQNTLDEYEKRMPPKIMKKVGHANKLAGGHDNKQIK